MQVNETKLISRGLWFVLRSMKRTGILEQAVAAVTKIRSLVNV